ncbi:GNAT family N-acetyltransferase [Lysinibacillus pakistanensis]|uniref:GNAT family N-acetyltransferase n=1 Tax=Lysinibacillus pakistanensis TaxID=759811 RepID=UPI003D26C5B2
MKLVKSKPELLDEEVTILNSDYFFNQISKNKDVYTKEEILDIIQESQRIGAERFLIQKDNQYVGILELLMKNPNDGYPWLGLLQIHKDTQGHGYGNEVMDLFYTIMQERGVKTFRLGVIDVNEPGHRFWKRQGMIPVKSVIDKDGKKIIVYEKDIVFQSE